MSPRKSIEEWQRHSVLKLEWGRKRTSSYLSFQIFKALALVFIWPQLDTHIYIYIYIYREKQTERFFGHNYGTTRPILLKFCTRLPRHAPDTPVVL